MAQHLHIHGCYLSDGFGCAVHLTRPLWIILIRFPASRTFGVIKGCLMLWNKMMKTSPLKMQQNWDKSRVLTGVLIMLCFSWSRCKIIIYAIICLLIYWAKSNTGPIFSTVFFSWCSKQDKIVQWYHLEIFFSVSWRLYVKGVSSSLTLTPAMLIPPSGWSGFAQERVNHLRDSFALNIMKQSRGPGTFSSIC